VGLQRWWGAPNSDALADITLDRVARKLEEGAEIGEGSFGAYVRGVARMVFHEAVRQEQRVRASELGALQIHPSATNETFGGAFTCLDRCLPQLAEQERKLVLSYYGEGKKDDVRRRLAAELGISSTALRIRTCRLRERLERCVKGCLAAS
jgi:DNA-directed RNA polymerase specialized sigma24 family protein